MGLCLSKKQSTTCEEKIPKSETIDDSQSSDIKSLSNVKQKNQNVRNNFLSEQFTNSIDKLNFFTKKEKECTSPTLLVQGTEIIVTTSKVFSTEGLSSSSQAQALSSSSSSCKNLYDPNRNDDDNDNVYGSNDSSVVSPQSTLSASPGNVFNGAANSSRRSTDFSGGSRLNINWSDITINAIKKEECIVGEGSFGVVIKGTWRKNKRQVDVAIKLLTKNNFQKIMNGNVSFQDMSEFAWKEVGVMNEAELCLADTECIVKVYGVAEGILPDKLVNFFNLPYSCEGVGVISRFEGGGSLENLLHTSFKKISLPEKIRILIGVSIALVELHSSGIIHADIKSSNVLLSHHNPPKIRLSDFGMSLLKDPEVGDGIGYSTLSLTNHRRGTPVYSAPETLVNPFGAVGKPQGVAQSSRKTDMYSFGILAWEVFARKKPFQDMHNETVLCGKVHKGIRPPLDQIPADSPSELISLIVSCWDKERSKRKSAVEVLSILQSNMERLTAGQFDVFFSHVGVSKPLISHIYQMLTKMGYRVWCDQNDMGSDTEESMRHGIASSKVVIACINSTYQQRETCMFQLRQAEASSMSILALVSENEPLTWTTQEVQDICKLKSRLYVNIADIAKLTWNDEQGPTKEMFEDLTNALQPISKLLLELGCQPSALANTGELIRQQSSISTIASTRLSNSFELEPDLYIATH